MFVWSSRLTAPLAFCIFTFSPFVAQSQNEPTSDESSGPLVRLQAEELVLQAPDGGTSTLKLGCAGSAFIVHRQRVYVACGERGVVIVDAADPANPRLLGTAEAGGEVKDLFIRADRVWAEIERREARPVEEMGFHASSSMEGAPLSAKATRSLPREIDSERAVARVGRVVATSGGEVVITLGKNDHLQTGRHVELYEDSKEHLGDGETIVREIPFAVGKVTAVGNQRARVALGVDERAPVHAKARPTSKPLSKSLIAPPRVPDVWEIQFAVRPFLSLNDLGVGVLANASIGYRASRSFFARALFDPVGFEAGNGKDAGLFSGHVLVGYDHRLFEIGLGVGVARINEPQERTIEGDITTDETGTGFSLAQSIRLGSNDGLHLAVTNSFILFHDEFLYGSTNGTIQIPLADRTWLILRGGGGITGHGYGEVGLRRMLRGNGTRGSLFVTPTLGGSAVFGDFPTFAGPSVGVGLEWRI